MQKKEKHGFSYFRTNHVPENKSLTIPQKQTLLNQSSDPFNLKTCVFFGKYFALNDLTTTSI